MPYHEYDNISIINLWELSVAMRNLNFDLIRSKTLWKILSTSVMLHIKFDQVWPAGLLRYSSFKFFMLKSGFPWALENMENG